MLTQTTPAALIATAPQCDFDLTPHGCGWFQSSEELAEGLIVIERREADVTMEMIFGAAWRQAQAGAALGG